jgi:malate permease and related proteins
MAFGFVLSKWFKWPRIFFKYASLFIMNFALPLYFFTGISKTTRANVIEGAIFPPFALILIIALFLISYLIFTLFRISGPERRTGIALSTFGNSGYIPLSLIEIFPITLPLLVVKFDPKISTLFIGTYLLINSPLLWSFGNFLVGSKNKYPKPLEFFTPPLAGITAGLLIVIFNLQDFLFNKNLPFYYVYMAFDKIGSITLPLIMITLGSMIAEIKLEESNRTKLTLHCMLVSFVRLIVSPVLYWVLFFFVIKKIHLTPVQNWVIFLQMHVPAATNLSVMSHNSGQNENLISFNLLISYIGYLILLPVYIFLFMYFAINY